MKVKIFIIAVALFGGQLGAQRNVFADPRIADFTQYLPIAQLYNYYSDGISAYRIQVINTNKNAEALAIRRDMQLLVPELRVFFIYREPYYRVRVGAFMTEKDAEPYRKKIDNYYQKKRTVITLPEIIPLKECLEEHKKKAKDYSDFFQKLPDLNEESIDNEEIPY